MGYQRQNFKIGQVLKADHLNKIESGIVDLENMYLDGRTHYKETVIATVLPDMEVSFMSMEEGVKAAPIGDFEKEIEADNEYTVTIGGKAYECISKGMEHEVIEGLIVTVQILGNAKYLGMDDTGEPFMIFYVPPEGRDELGCTAMVISYEDVSSASLMITCEEEVTVKLPKEYYDVPVPDMAALVNEEGHIRNRTHWAAKIDGGKMVFYAAQKDSYPKALNESGEVCGYKISDVPLTKYTVEKCGGVVQNSDKFVAIKVGDVANAGPAEDPYGFVAPIIAGEETVGTIMVAFKAAMHNIDVNVVFPEAGTYVALGEGYLRLELHVAEVVEPLPAKYITLPSVDPSEPIQSLKLVDSENGKIYELAVSGGKLTMKEV